MATQQRNVVFVASPEQSSLSRVIDVRNSNTSSVEYCVHYAGWNTRYDEWIKYDAIISVIDTPTTDATTPAAGRQKQTSVSASTSALSAKKKAVGSALTAAVPGRQKRLPVASATDSGKTLSKPQAAKIPRRRTRTRSRTHTAADSDSESLSSSGSASDMESVGRRASVTDSSQATSVAADEQRETSKSSDVANISSQLQPTDSIGDQTSVPVKSEPDGKLCETSVIDRQEGTADRQTTEDVPKLTSSTDQTCEGQKLSTDLDTSHTAAVAKEDVESPVKTRGKSRVFSRSMSSNVDACAASDLEGSAVDSAAESGKTKLSAEDRTKTPRVKKKCIDEDNSDKVEKKVKTDARKPSDECKPADDECSNDREGKVTTEVKDEETSQKDKVSDLKEKDEKQELDLNDPKGKGKDGTDEKWQKALSTRKGGIYTTTDSSGREKRSRAEKTDSSEVAEQSFGRGRRKAKLGPSDVVLSEAENSQEAEQYSVCETSDSASTKLESKAAKQETDESSSLEGFSTANDFSRKITDTTEAKTDTSENSETTNSGAVALGIEHADVVSLLTATFTDSPAYTSADELGPAGGSSSSSAGGTSSLSPAADADEEHTSTKSELEANMEVAAYMGGGSTNEGELSSDEDDDDSSSLNTLSRKPSAKIAAVTTKRKSEDASFQNSGKRRRREKQHRTRSQHALSATKSYSYRNDASDSDDNDMPTRATKPSADVSATGNFPSKLHGARIVKYNFLDLKEGQCLEGEERIAFLMSKIQDLRRVYMDLKAEVACIDRRRRRHRMKEREAQQQANTGSLTLVPTATSS